MANLGDGACELVVQLRGRIRAGDVVSPHGHAPLPRLAFRLPQRLGARRHHVQAPVRCLHRQCLTEIPGPISPHAMAVSQLRVAPRFDTYEPHSANEATSVTFPE